MRTKILGTGHYVPDNVVTNAQLAKIFDSPDATSDAWIIQRTGIKQRHFVDFVNAPMGAAEMGARAARRALEAADIAATDVDLIVYATLSPDHQFPGDGVLVQAKLDIPSGVPAIDVRNQCSGFLYALSIADAFVQVGRYRRVLVIGAECHSTGLDFTARGRDVAVLFGDAGAAVVVGPSDDASSGILSIDLHADGRHAQELRLSCPSSAQSPRLSAANLERAEHYPAMNGKNVFKHAVTRMPETVAQILAKHKLAPADIHLLITHQANLRISEMVAQKLRLEARQVFNNIDRFGNTTAASIPLALDEAVRAGRLQRGDLLCLASFGAGFTWGSALIRW